MSTPLSLEQFYREHYGARFDELTHHSLFPKLNGRPFWKVPRHFVLKRVGSYSWSELPKNVQAVLPVLKVFSSHDMSDCSSAHISELSGLCRSQVSGGLRYVREHNLIESKLVHGRRGKYGHAKKIFIGPFSERQENNRRFAMFRREIIKGGHWSKMTSTEKAIYFVLIHGLQLNDLEQLVRRLRAEPASFVGPALDVPPQWRGPTGGISWRLVMDGEWDDQEKVRFGPLLSVRVGFWREDQGIITRQFLAHLAGISADSVAKALRGLEKKRLLLILAHAAIGNIPGYGIFVPPPGEWMLLPSRARSEISNTVVPKFHASASEKSDT